MALVKSREHIQALMEIIREVNYKLEVVDPNGVTTRLEEVRQRVVERPHALTASTYADEFTNIGAIVVSMIGLHEFDQNAFADMLLAKHQKYGEKPIVSWGGLGVMIRIYSKWERYQNLMAIPNVSDGGESIHDTLQDILGYCVLGLAYDERLRYERSASHA